MTIRSHAFQESAQIDKQRSVSEPANAWRTLVPLRSSRSDVERLFGTPDILLGARHLYKFESENVAFTYARGNCDPFDSGWDVPVDTILKIEVTPQIVLPIGKSGFDLTKFRQTEMDHPNLVIYTALEEGVTIHTKTIRDSEAIVSIQFVASVREKGLACSPKPVRR